jgi:hypothetical protein
MSYFSKKDYKFLRFQKSNTANKKYDAILENKKTKKTKKIPFGDKRYEQYQDTTGLGIYTHKDHKDKKRRFLYRQRHMGYLKEGYYSPSFFSWAYLW